jgi:transaldolase
MMAKLGVDYISPFVGRLTDNKGDGIELIKQLRHMLDWYGFETQLLAASIRDTISFEKVIMAGADITTLPVSIFEKSLLHELTTAGMEQFLIDWKQLNIKKFP